MNFVGVLIWKDGQSFQTVPSFQRLSKVVITDYSNWDAFSQPVWILLPSRVITACICGAISTFLKCYPSLSGILHLYLYYNVGKAGFFKKSHLNNGETWTWVAFGEAAMMYSKACFRAGSVSRLNYYGLAVWLWAGFLSSLCLNTLTYSIRINTHPPGLKELTCVLYHTNQICLPALILYEMETTDWFWRGIEQGNRTNSEHWKMGTRKSCHRWPW